MDNGQKDQGELSQSSQTVLIVAGVSAALFVGYLIWGLIGCIRAAARVLTPAPGASKAAAKGKAKSKAPAKAKGSDSEAEPAAVPGKERGPDLKSLIKAEKVASKKKGVTKEDHAAAHELFLNTLKDHADTVHSVAWSRDGRQLATACEDMQIRVFDLADIGNKNPKFKRVRTSRIPMGVGFADVPDGVATAMRGVPDTLCAVYAPQVKTPGDAPVYGPVWQVGNVHGKEPVLAMMAVPSEQAVGRRGFIATLSAKREGRIFDMNGKELGVFEPNALTNHDLAVSNDGRFLAVACFSSDVKIWEMKYTREGEFRGCIKAMGLSGHKSQVACVALSPDNRRAATASKDGMLKVWNIDVRYDMSEDPKVVLSIPVPLPEGKVYQHLAFGPPGSNILAASYEGFVHLLSLSTGELLERIDAHDLTVTCVRWCPVPRPLEGGGVAFVFATASRDKRVRVWRAPKI